ncbi:xanthine dehydrogenase family protein molybdopterin-binding subunit [Rhodoplanes sp. Z2-YC6860]|uniref:xanthine dehydrogenase family protein molybdopterin-binding subunit n=1 Tax=Rhodoplanes sp. Z2-YC6860 TaxID=674703 RepID=UPI000A557E94|nr:xanthine dehydrogenase family protein molybdopterin-binding subunit [Rhodoplanes sp. Z2-YC6860]
MVTGRGRYTSDHHFDGQVAGHFVRADRAHAKIVRIDIDEAKRLPGVLDVVVGSDLAATGWKGAPAMAFFKGVGGSSVRVPFRTGLAQGRVRFVGEPVALVVAETENIAQDAAELIAIEYEDLPIYVEPGDALASGAVPLHEDYSDNLAFDYEYGDRKSTEPGFAEAAHVVRVTLHAQRISGNPMEPKSCTALYSASDDSYEVCIPTQGAGDIKNSLAAITGMPPEKFKIRSMDVGGGFGVRNEVYPEFLAVMLAAKRTGKPVKWLGTRSETLSGDHHGRGADLMGELALDAKGRFLALRVEWLVNLGAFSSNAGPLINTVAAPTSSAVSLYDIRAVHGRHRLVFTNTTPTTAYRGAGRPNVAYLWERLIEDAAEVMGIDPVKLRRRNLLRKNAFPFKTPTGSSYDSADPARLLDTALQAADWDGFKARRKAAQKNGKLRGLGLALFLEPSGGMGKEQVEIRVASSGKLELYSQAGPSGQGHETVFPVLVADVLGIPDDRVELRYNEPTAPKLVGVGTFGSRSLICHGAALQAAAKEIVEKGKKLAATELEVAPTDVTFDKGVYRVTGTDLTISMKVLIEKRWGEAAHPLDTNIMFDIASAFPSGAHIAEVEIDPDTGSSAIVNYIAADDCGNIVNHKLVEGQLHGGLMQGIGQVIGEHIAYDNESGQLLSGTFMDYFMPKAHNLTPVTLIDCGVPSPFNPLGAKGAGEAGATGSVPALANAYLNALKMAGVKKLEMPYTPARVWRAIQDAKAANGAA